MSSAQQWQVLVNHGGTGWTKAKVVACRKMPPGDSACPVLQWHHGTTTIEMGYANLAPSMAQAPFVRMDLVGNTDRVATDPKLPYVFVSERFQWPTGSVPRVSYVSAALDGPNGRQSVGFGGAVAFPPNAYLAAGRVRVRIVLYTVPHYGHTGPDILRGVGSFPIRSQGEPNMVAVGTTSGGPSDAYGVSGTPHAGLEAYVRLSTAQSFTNAALTLVAWKRTGKTWHRILDQGIAVNPQDNILLEPFMVKRPGKYRVAFYNGLTMIGEAGFTALP